MSFICINTTYAQTKKESVVKKETKNLKVLSYNIWNGFDWGKDTDRHKKLIPWINSKKPDVVALQELCGYTKEKLEIDAKNWGHDYSVLLKTDGHSVGITSNKPIVLKGKIRENLWHGMLHVETWGIDFFVVHLSPMDRNFRYKEALIISKKIEQINNNNFIVLGDFNAHSPFDGELDLTFPKLLEEMQKNNLKNKQYDNLLDGQNDYSVMSKFLSIPLIDVIQRFVQPKDRFTFPGKASIGISKTVLEVKENRTRIDFILVSRELAKNCKSAFVFNKEDTTMLSDHFPVMAEFLLFD